MTELKWAALVVIVAWILGLIRVCQHLYSKEDDDLEDDVDREAAAEESRRRAALGYLTRLDAKRRVERIEPRYRIRR